MIKYLSIENVSAVCAACFVLVSYVSQLFFSWIKFNQIAALFCKSMDWMHIHRDKFREPTYPYKVSAVWIMPKQ